MYDRRRGEGIDEGAVVAVVGAGGFVGQHLVRALLRETGYTERAIVRERSRCTWSHPRLEVVLGDVRSRASMDRALSGVKSAYYLVHMLTSDASTLSDDEAAAAEAFGEAARDGGVSRVVYLSGLGNDTDTLSRHLKSRHRTGDILRTHVPSVIEFRASIIVGDGSISFEIVRALVRTLPIILLPHHADTLVQPIGIGDVVRYLVHGLDVPSTGHEIVEVGGPEVLSYKELMEAYARHIGVRRIAIRVPFLPDRIAGYGFFCFVPRRMARVGINMVESFQNEMIVTNNRARELFPDILPEPIEQSFT